MAYPSSLPSYAGFTSTHTLQADNHAAQSNQEQTDITAIATKVGTGASTSTNNTVLRGNGTGTTAYDQVHLATDVSGVLPATAGGTGITSLGSGIPTFLGTPSSANLAAALTDETGTGANVFANNPTLSQPGIADFTNAQHGHTGASSGGTLGSGALQTNAVQSNQLATNAITLGYAQITTSFTHTGDTNSTQVTGLTITVTIPGGSRLIKVTAFAPGLYNSSNITNSLMTIWDGVVGSGTQLAYGYGNANSSASTSGYVVALITPSPGSKTYNVGLRTGNSATTATIEAGAFGTGNAFILVEVA